MGFLDRILGTPAPRRAPQAAAPINEDQAVERYRYMLQTAPPETIEQAHREAFEKLTPEQRRQVLTSLAQAAPASESAAIAATPLDDTKGMARAATRAEIRQPGAMERMLGGGGMGFGASLLSSFAMGFVGSMVANSFFSALGGFGEGGSDANADDANADEEGDTVAENDDTGDDGGGDFGGDDFEV